MSVSSGPNPKTSCWTSITSRSRSARLNGIASAETISSRIRRISTRTRSISKFDSLERSSVSMSRRWIRSLKSCKITSGLVVWSDRNGARGPSPAFLSVSQRSLSASRDGFFIVLTPYLFKPRTGGNNRPKNPDFLSSPASARDEPENMKVFTTASVNPW